MSRMCLVFLPVSLVLAAALAGPAAAGGPGVDLETARRAARARLAAEAPETAADGFRAPLADVPREVAAVTPLAGPDGETNAYIMDLAPAGFMVVTACTDLPPVLAWSPEGAWPHGDERAPLARIVRTDLAARLAARPRTDPAARQANSERWQQLLDGKTKLSEPRWGPLLQTAWGQSGTIREDHPATYNQYCPLDPLDDSQRSVAGCTAVATAQVLNYWGFPRLVSFGESDRYTSRAPRLAWDDDYAESRENKVRIDQDHEDFDFPSFDRLNRKLGQEESHCPGIRYQGDPDEIAALVSAAGIALQSEYSADNTYARPRGSVFRKKFNYRSAQWRTNASVLVAWLSDLDIPVFSYEDLRRDMMAGRPALLAIARTFARLGNKALHCVVVDGYDEADGTFHLNLGWPDHEGNTAWYSLPWGMPDGYDVVIGGVLEISPHGNERVVHGRYIQDIRREVARAGDHETVFVPAGTWRWDWHDWWDKQPAYPPGEPVQVTRNIVITSPGAVIDLEGFGPAFHVLGTRREIPFDPGDPSHLAGADPRLGGVISGFTITGGAALAGAAIEVENAEPLIFNNVLNGNSASLWGGGVSCTSGGQAIIRANRITGNRGGGISVERGASPVISDNIITGSSPSDQGYGSGITILGDISRPGRTRPVIAGNLIADNNNALWSGGGIHGSDALPVIRDNIISRNRAAGGSGGGIYLHNLPAGKTEPPFPAPLVEGNTISANIARDSGGGLFLALPLVSETVEIRRNLITGNEAGAGGGVFVSDAGENVLFSGNAVSGNEAGAEGGGFHLSHYSSPRLENNVVSHNRARRGAGLYLHDSSSPVIRHQTIAFNEAGEKGGGLYLDMVSQPALVNSILWGNLAADRPEQVYLGAHAADFDRLFRLRHCCVEGGEDGLDGPGRAAGEYEWGEGNRDDDPLFQDPDQQPDWETIQLPGRRLKRFSAGLAPGEDSPCLDRGTADETTAADIRGVSRPQGTAPDIGAYEYEPPVRRIISGTVTLHDGTGLPGEVVLTLAGAGPVRTATPDETGRFQFTLSEDDGPYTLAAGLERYAFLPPARLLPGGADYPAQDFAGWTDSDGEGMGDAWQMEHFGTRGHRPEDDTDGSGYPNIYQFVHGSDPTDPGSIPEATVFVAPDGCDETGDGGPGAPWRTLARAIAAAPPFGIIEAADGIYSGPGNHGLTWDADAKNLFIRSENGPENCIIDLAETPGRAFFFAETGRRRLDIVEGFTIRGGAAGRGGAIRVTRAAPVIRHCVLTGNRAEDGGALYAVDSALLLADVIISDNRADRGAGLYLDGTGAGQARFVGVVVTANHASGKGGGLYAGPSQTLFDLESTVVADNSAGHSGGGLHLSRQAAPWLYNCVVATNKALAGAGLYLDPESAPRLFSSTVFGNRAVADGGGLHVAEMSEDQGARIHNSILWGNRAETGGGQVFLAGSPGATAVSHSCVEDGAPALAGPGGDDFAGWGAGNLDADPLFLRPEEPAGFDGTWRSAADGLRLRAGSPAAQSGSPDLAPLSDILGQARPTGHGYAMGAYEAVVSDSDLNLDGQTGLEDVLFLLRMSLDLPVKAAGARAAPPWPAFLLERAGVDGGGRPQPEDVGALLRLIVD